MDPFHRGKKVVTFILCSAIFVLAYVATLQAQPNSVDADPVLIAVGDIATCSSTKDSATATLVDSIAGTIATLGDTVYPDGTASQFANCYAPTWGRHKARTKPIPGNHDYHTAGAAGYYSYFGAAASPLDTNCTNNCKGYYSYNLGAWHIIALNSEIAMTAGSAQEKWLRADLAAHPAVCTLAYWHKPRFSSGSEHGNNANTQPLWQALYDYGADVILGGHDHNYERFAPQTPTGQAAPGRGIREFVVGTGGTGLRAMGSTQPNSEMRNSNTWGVLKLTLHATSYDWKFVPIAGQTFTDTGSANCVSSGTSPTTRDYSFTTVADSYVQSDRPSTNFGNVNMLKVDASPTIYSYLRFNVQGLAGTVVSAKLYIYANNSSSQGYELRGVSSNSWGETTITYQNRPARGAVVGRSGAVSSGTWTVVTVTSLVKGNGTLSLAMTGTSSTSISFSSRQGAYPPKLVVTTSTSGQAAIEPVNGTNEVQTAVPPVDSDGDELSDEDEVANGTDLSRPDSDGDGLPDLWEVEGVLNATSSSGHDGVQGDPDGDGITNLEEYNGQTDPMIHEDMLVEVVTGELFLPLIAGG